jgi:uncharacterized membrane protein HdeD (DUF308 family)
MLASSFNGTMASGLSRAWRVILVRGVVAVLFGLLALVWPRLTLLALILLFGIYAIIDGVASFAHAFDAGRRGQNWVWPVIVGIMSIAAGIIALVWPGETALILVFIIAAWALITGISEIISGISLRREITDEWLLVLGGVISVVFGVLVFLRPGAGALALVWLIGFYAIVLGAERIAFAFRVRNWTRSALPHRAPQMPRATA